MSGIQDSETGLVISIIISSILAVSCVTITVFVMWRLWKYSEEVIRYFKCCIIFTLIFGVLATCFTVAFCINQLVSPYNWFIHGPKWWAHQSFILRLITTVTWYLQKIGLFYIFNGRLYYGFCQSKYAVPKCVLISLNIATPTIALTGLFVGYYSYINYLSEDLISFCFQSFRVWWSLMSVVFMVLFNVRLLSVCTYTFCI